MTHAHEEFDEHELGVKHIHASLVVNALATGDPYSAAMVHIVAALAFSMNHDGSMSLAEAQILGSFADVLERADPPAYDMYMEERRP